MIYYVHFTSGGCLTSLFASKCLARPTRGLVDASCLVLRLAIRFPVHLGLDRNRKLVVL